MVAEATAAAGGMAVPTALTDMLGVVVTMFKPFSKLTPFLLLPVALGPPSSLFPALLALALGFLGFGFLGALFVPMDTTGLVGMMTIVPPPGDVVATVDD